ncbi:Akirin [Entamoeba marina]
MAFSLTKRQCPENLFFSNNDQDPLAFTPKRLPKQDNLVQKRPQIFPHVEVSIDEVIRNSGKTQFSVDDVREIVTAAVRINEAKVREEYNGILTSQLQQQFQSFSRYQQDYLTKQYGESNISYYS